MIKMKDWYFLTKNNVKLNLRNKFLPLVSVVALSALILQPKISEAATHYVSPSGSSTWANSTNIATPCSLGTANANAVAGDLVYLRGGTYTGKGLKPNKNGSRGNVVTFRAYPKETPVIDGEDTNYNILLYGKSFITIDGIDSINSLGNYNIYVNNGSSMTDGITIQNCQLDGGGVYIMGTQNIIIKNNNFINQAWSSITFQGHTTNRSTQTRVEGNTLSGTYVGTDALTYHVEVDGTQPLGAYHLIKNNSVTMSWGGSGSENCFDITSGTYIVLDGNTCTGAVAEPAYLIGNGAGGSNTVAWIRVVNSKTYNTFNGSEHINLDGRHDTKYIQILRNISYGRGELNFRQGSSDVAHVRIFHNAFDTSNMKDNLGILILDAGAYSAADFSLKNNMVIMAGADYAISWGNPLDSDMSSDYNLYYNKDDNLGKNLWFETYKTLSEIQSNYSLEINGFEDAPGVTDLNKNDYTIEEGSPAIDAGGWLTTITSATGSGTTFTVKDPLWFYDGWKIVGETGDVISTENRQIATITAINYNTGSITVSSPISWTRGEGIGLYYKGIKPDIGPNEYPSSDNKLITPPRGLKLVGNN